MFFATLQNGTAYTYILDATNSISGATVAKEKNCADSFEFTIYPGNDGYDALVPFATLVEVTDSAKGTIFEGRVLTVTPSMDSNGLVSKSVICEGLLGYLNDSVQPYTEEQTWEDGSDETGLEKYIAYLLENHNARVENEKKVYVGEIDVDTYKTSDNVTKGTNFETTWECLDSKLIDVFGGEMRVRRGDDGLLYLDYADELGDVHLAGAEAAINLQSIEQSTDPNDVITRLYPRGAKLTVTETDEDGNEIETETEERLSIADANAGIEYIDDDEAMAEYGIIEGVNEWDDVTEAENLLAKAEVWLADNNAMPVTTSANVLDLSVLGYDYDAFELYDWYPVTNDLIGVSLTLEVVKQVIDLDDPSASSIEFGETDSTQSSNIAELSSLKNAVTYLGDSIETTIVNLNNTITYTKSAIEVAEDSILATVGTQIVTAAEEIYTVVEEKIAEITITDEYIQSLVLSTVLSSDGQSFDLVAGGWEYATESADYGDEGSVAWSVDGSTLHFACSNSYGDYAYSYFVAPLEDELVESATYMMNIEVENLDAADGCAICANVAYSTYVSQLELDRTLHDLTEDGLAIEMTAKESFASCNCLTVLGIYVPAGTSASFDVTVTLEKASDNVTVEDLLDYTLSAVTQSSDSITATVEEYLNGYVTESEFAQYADSIKLTVSGEDGYASIVLSVDGESTDCGTVVTSAREAFENDDSAITISAGTITFNSGTLVINSGYVSLTADGWFACTGGEIGGFAIDDESIYNDMVTLDSSGVHLVYDGADVGSVARNYWIYDEDQQGLVFDLDTDGGGAFMAWSVTDSSGTADYDTVLLYTAEEMYSRYGTLNADSIYFWADVDTRGYPLNVSNIKLYSSRYDDDATCVVSKSFWDDYTGVSMTLCTDSTDEAAFFALALGVDPTENTKNDNEPIVAYTDEAVDSYKSRRVHFFYPAAFHDGVEIDGALSGYINLSVITDVSGSGSFTFSNDCQLKFDNGLLVGCEWMEDEYEMEAT